MNQGCDSIVVSRQNPLLREADGLSWLLYTSSRAQGGGALYQSFVGNKRIRVFRSSALKSEYAPPPRQEGKTAYRYDGLYEVKCAMNELGQPQTKQPSPGGGQFTFLLERVTQHENGMFSPNREKLILFRNKLSVQQLWDAICDSNGIERNRFVPANPADSLIAAVDRWEEAQPRVDIECASCLIPQQQLSVDSHPSQISAHALHPNPA
mmetsp:Transcript_17218/g.49909  ORF Transcript_17218/g.49909 Transcript_17218/m.49909 type:complete len:209 (-) Transcript_17218:33-659(-)